MTDPDLTDPHPIEPRLVADDLVLGYEKDRPIVDGISFDVPTGAVTVLVGANACGKSTFLRGLARLLAPQRGSVILDGRSIHERPTREVATLLGLLPQSPSAPEGITVADLVARGRHPHQRWYRQWSDRDEEVVEHALARTGVAELAERRVDDLSGGQRQRVWIAVALAQETDLILLDEPTTYLDIAHQVEVLDIIRDLNRTDGRTVVAVLHDLHLACRYADHLVAMKAGRIVAQGEPSTVMTAALVQDVFGLNAQIITDPLTGTPIVLPVPSDDGGDGSDPCDNGSRALAGSDRPGP